MRKPLPPINEHMFPEATQHGYRWLDLIRNYSHDLQEYTVSVDLPSLASNSTTAQAITVTGVTIGDIVLHITPTTISDDWFIANSKVTAANTVTVQVCRVKAGSYDPAAENWTFLVLKNTR